MSYRRAADCIDFCLSITIKITGMKKFVIERNFPGAGNLTPDELKAISQTSCAAVNKLDKPYHWVQSYVTGDKLYCVHIAESEEVVREHAKLGKFPIHTIAEVKTVIDASTGGL
jgi:hypothetical protein